MRNAFPAKAYDYIGAGIPVLAGPRSEFSHVVEKLNIGITLEKLSANEVAVPFSEIKNRRSLVQNV